MNIKKNTLTLFLLLATSMSTFAQDALRERARQWTEDRVIARIHRADNTIDLTEEQMDKIIESKIEDIKKIKEINQSDMSQEEKQIATKTIYNGIYQMLKTILTPEQLKAWALGGQM